MSSILSTLDLLGTTAFIIIGQSGSLETSIYLEQSTTQVPILTPFPTSSALPVAITTTTFIEIGASTSVAPPAISPTALQTSTSQSLASITPTTTTNTPAFQTSTSQALGAATTGIIGSQPSTSTSSLTTGAKTGIAIGAIFGAILLMLLGAFASSLLQRRRRHTAIPQDEGHIPGIERETWEEKLKRKFSKKGLKGDGLQLELEGGGISAEGLSRKEMDRTH